MKNQKYDLYSKDFRSNSHNIFAKMRVEDPVIQQAGLDGETPVWFVTRYEDVQRILLDDLTFVRDPSLVYSQEQLDKFFGTQNAQVNAMMNNHMLNRDGEQHHRLRSLVSKAFTPKVILNLRPRIEEIAHGLIDRVEERGKMELVSEFAFPLPITVIAELIGIPLQNQDQFRLWSNAFVRPVFTEKEQQESLKLLMEFAVYMQNLVSERRQNPKDDLLSNLIHVEEQGDRLNESELFSMLSLLIVAGHETTVSLIGNGVLALLQNPEVMNELRENTELIPSALEELLRYDSPVERALTRFVAKDVEIDGRQLKCGDLVVVVLASANRDESRFSSPGQLDIHRKPNPHLAFGKGVHYCLGAPLARLEGEIALQVLLERLPGLNLDIAEKDMDWRDVALFRSLVRLPVRW